MDGVDETQETFEQVGRRFPELDEAARRRVAVRMAAGAEAQAAFAQESVMLQLVRAYN
ncbi:MAG TPA: hypothetical protein VKF59_08080 [Candidatus Dormibacteraeota bacterium]|nr:hypothetical protein [Candidatus Dormibacteraeota bacterium]